MGAVAGSAATANAAGRRAVTGARVVVPPEAGWEDRSGTTAERCRAGAGGPGGWAPGAELDVPGAASGRGRVRPGCEPGCGGGTGGPIRPVGTPASSSPPAVPPGGEANHGDGRVGGATISVISVGCIGSGRGRRRGNGTGGSASATSHPAGCGSGCVATALTSVSRDCATGRSSSRVLPRVAPPRVGFGVGRGVLAAPVHENGAVAAALLRTGGEP